MALHDAEKVVGPELGSGLSRVEVANGWLYLYVDGDDETLAAAAEFVHDPEVAERQDLDRQASAAAREHEAKAKDAAP